MRSERTRIRAEIMRSELGFSLRMVARACGVSKSSVFVWTSSPRERSNTKRGPNALHSRIKGAILDSVQRCPLVTAVEISAEVYDATGLMVSRTTVYKSLKLLNISHKIASRCRMHQPRNMSHPFFHGDPFSHDAMAFDEAGFYINSVPKRGWGKKGHRVPKAQIARSARLSLLLVTDRHGVVASRLLAGGVKGSHIADFIKTLPKGRPMILDNAASHRTKEVGVACSEAGITLNFMPPYSPWYNPVENAFAQAKAHFQKIRRVRGGFESDIMRSVDRVRSFLAMFESSAKMWREDTA